MRKIILLLLLSHMAAGQWISKGQMMAELGSLPPFNINVKAGYVFKDNVVAGIFAEHQDLFTRRSEIGVFGRKYMSDKGRMTFYLHGGASVGHYETWSWGKTFTREQMREDRTFNALKFIGGGGISYRVSNTVSLGHEATLGISNYKANWYPTLLFTLNYRFKP